MKHTLAQSFRFALSGLALAWRTQRNLRIHAVAAAAVVVAVALLPLGSAERAVLVLAAALVVAAELFNTAVEMLVDLLSSNGRPPGHPARPDPGAHAANPDRVAVHPPSPARAAKDLAAAAVLVLAAGAAAAGVLVLLPHLP
ncbi:MAG: diacylglycerol kinase [Armatimonadota bacterium]|nr:diacylglycerol kinase [Armatimonadota bacterium]MDR7447909.1 diacylglycerol kinase [Armatimonadota bacterium]MDR7460640.1 diacylglycerol kinase [Armatimonadota bacterium]MDR7479743.1 diacylglycerol kinase [Armatimonadota bacterium]MDR7489475.1 diacylglycerol kinase [Armatimonadota bacterium]